MKTCIICNSFLDNSRFEKNRNQCKGCRSKRGNKRIKERLENNEIELDTRIKMWTNIIRNSPERKLLSKDLLFKLAKEALVKYPYMVFINSEKKLSTRGHSAKPNSASLDKINPKMGYTEDNIQIIPMWLNMAKLNKSISDILPYLRDFSQKYSEFIKHFQLTITD